MLCAVHRPADPWGAPAMTTIVGASESQPRVDALDVTDSSASARTTASTIVASMRESQAPRASAARA